MKALIDRLADRFDVDDNDCWNWTGITTASGYGRLKSNGRRVMAHRAMYELVVGPIPVELEIDHLCHNRRCVNPDHLEAVTHQENMNRSIVVARTHCKHDHEFTPENTYVYLRGQRPMRQCRACHTERKRRSRHLTS